MSSIEDDVASRPDDEAPEWARDEVGKPGSALAVIESVFGTDAAETSRRRPSRSREPDRKVNQTLRLDVEMLEAYRREGEGWRTR
ncbi:MAG: BrnA antitoxin family protein [Methylobacterium sp.]|uniref:BrnA antitoxin family protein n=1 Tax=Methylobacterium sp. TaxID=409 RepID=UPI0025DF4807|nr:BrnA antitoxin family protein [Methylobacterium sp.]MBX9931721.1 BrnA antitoxin family protein [Methylobacterium sp.]